MGKLDIQKGLVRWYGHVEWRRTGLEISFALLVSYLLSFLLPLSEYISRWVDSTWSDSSDMGRVLLADRTVALTVAVAVAIPLEGCLVKLVSERTSRRVGVYALTAALCIAIFAIGISRYPKAVDWWSMTPLEYDSLSAEETLQIDRAFMLHLTLMVALFPLICLSRMETLAKTSRGRSI
jgi:hypothetical protein